MTCFYVTVYQENFRNDSPCVANMEVKQICLLDFVRASLLLDILLGQLDACAEIELV